jgi:hypothetical protein
MYTFIANWANRGTTIFKGVSLIKGTFIETDEFVSLVGNATFQNIPKSVLTAYVPALPANKVKVKKPKTLIKETKPKAKRGRKAKTTKEV